MKKLFLLICIPLVLAACGRKGPLIPPEAVLPAPIADLQVEQKGVQFLVSWSAPTKDLAGRPLRDLTGFKVFRREVLPPVEDCEECPTAYHLIKTVDKEYLQDVVVVGSRYFLDDPELIEGKTYQYKAVSFQRDGTESRVSNKVRRKRVTPPDAPAVKAVSSPTGVALTWEPPRLRDAYVAAGFNVYRKRSGASFLPRPLNTTPLQVASFEDRRLERGVSYIYAIRTVARVDGETVESEPSKEVTGELTEPD